jgi:hypothetical protein
VATTTNKGITHGWLDGEDGWGDETNESLRRLDAYAVDQWATDEDATTGLTYGYRAGMVVSPAYVPSLVAAGTVSLTNGATNYVERTPAGVVTANTSGWTTGSLPMAVVTTSGGAITDIADRRLLASSRAPDAISIPIPEIGNGTDVLATTERELILWTNVTANITGWTVSADASGSVVLKVEQATYANFPTWTEVFASNRPTLSSAQKNHASGLTPVAITGETAWHITVVSASTVKAVSLAFHGTRG